MKTQIKGNKTTRLLKLLQHLGSGQCVSKCELAQQFEVSEKSIQRDIEDLRDYMSNLENYRNCEVRYNRIKKGYYIEGDREDRLTIGETVVVVKILLESRALVREELESILQKVLKNISQEDRGMISKIIGNEQLHYTELTHKSKIIDKILGLSMYIEQQEILEISYKRQDGKKILKHIKPLNIMFSEYYFYLIAYNANEKKEDNTPIMYRIDRIQTINMINQKFRITYNSRFEEGEFRKRIQFMYSGELRTIKFKFFGYAIEAVLDRLPTAVILEQNKDEVIFKATIYGSGIEMWLLSQGYLVEVLEPVELRQQMIERISRMKKIYE
ncbi:MAG: WYL domain-containing protein [Cellulosilyticaceae bacterium]